MTTEAYVESPTWTSGRVGVVAVGHYVYWPQFEGLRERLLGHRDLSTTSVYCHVSRALLENVRSPADRLGGAR